MGQEVSHSHFSTKEKEQFKTLLKTETKLLKEKMLAGEFSSKAAMGGFEVEACLVDKSLQVAPVNNKFFELFDNPLATPELAKFNIELNNTPLSLHGSCLPDFEYELRSVFDEAELAANKLDTNILLTGILPTAKPDDFCLDNMSSMKRYKALNEIIVKARNNKPLVLDIDGKDHCHLTKHTVMIEAATTSFQIHLQTPWKQSHHYYNASIIASAPIMAIAANSPFLFGKKLWHETRIPLFEQSIDTGSGKKRVSFGSGYAEISMSECFDENNNDFEVLLPMIFESKADEFKHLCLHNGVIWRWNRPLVGFDKDGTPHIRIEHRILPAGPTISDMMANAAFYYGLTQDIMREITDHPKMSFETAKSNFYQSAKYGLEANIKWNNKDYRAASLKKLIIEELLPRAKAGLQQLGISDDSIHHYLNIIEKRTSTGQTGAVWQINHLKTVNGDFQQLTSDYLHHLHQSEPVHTWKP